LRRQTIYIILLALLFATFVAIEYLAPKPIDWTESYSRKDKIPYGGYVIYELLPEIFPNQSININSQSLYMAFRNDEVKEQNIISITNHFNPSDVDLDKLLAYISVGHTLFISTEQMSKKLADTLHVNIEYFFSMLNNDTLLHVKLNNPKLSPNKEYEFSKMIQSFYFTKFDTAQTTVVGSLTDKKINFIRTKFGNGLIYVHLAPQVFTNYGLLKHNNTEYAERCLSYLPVAPVLWDEYYKPVNIQAETPLRYILTDRALRLAYYILLTGLLLYILIKAKRRQRAIPVIEKPRNSSVEYAETLGRLYFHNKDHRDIALKKYLYFSEFVRNKYMIKNIANQPDEIEKFANRTGVNVDTIKSLILLHQNIVNQNNIDENLLQQFSSAIEKFYKECQ